MQVGNSLDLLFSKSDLKLVYGDWPPLKHKLSNYILPTAKLISKVYCAENISQQAKVYKIALPRHYILKYILDPNKIISRML